MPIARRKAIFKLEGIGEVEGRTTNHLKGMADGWHTYGGGFILMKIDPVCC
jgi:hypothetical protein